MHTYNVRTYIPQGYLQCMRPGHRLAYVCLCVSVRGSTELVVGVFRVGYVVRPLPRHPSAHTHTLLDCCCAGCLPATLAGRPAAVVVVVQICVSGHVGTCAP